MKRWLAGARILGTGLVLAAAASAAWAQGPVTGRVWQPTTLLTSVISTVIFGLVGTGLAILGFKLFDWISPFDLEREICEKQNLAVAILSGAMILGISIIVAVAVI